MYGFLAAAFGAALLGWGFLFSRSLAQRAITAFGDAAAQLQAPEASLYWYVTTGLVLLAGLALTGGKALRSARASKERDRQERQLASGG